MTFLWGLLKGPAAFWQDSAPPSQKKYIQSIDVSSALGVQTQVLYAILCTGRGFQRGTIVLYKSLSLSVCLSLSVSVCLSLVHSLSIFFLHLESPIFPEQWYIIKGKHKQIIVTTRQSAFSTK